MANSGNVVTIRDGGRVIQLVTDDELLINLGSIHGVTAGMRFKVLDPTTLDVTDPVTGEKLGSIDRVKAQIQVTQVSERFSLAEVHPPRGRSGIGSAAQVLMEPKPPSATLTGDTWPDGVQVGDPLKYVEPKLTRR